MLKIDSQISNTYGSLAKYQPGCFMEGDIVSVCG